MVHVTDGSALDDDSDTMSKYNEMGSDMEQEAVKLKCCALGAALMLGLLVQPAVAGTVGILQFDITIPAPVVDHALDGCLLVLLSKNIDRHQEPRFEINTSWPLRSQQVFGQDVHNLVPGGRVIVENAAAGYPLARLSEIPPGTYRVQAVFNRYVNFHLGNGKSVWLPPDEGEGQKWNTKHGNLYSKPKIVHVLAGRASTLALRLTEKIPALPATPDTEYIKHVKYLSPELSRFWGRKTYIAAKVLLPEGWATHPDAHYPLVVFHGHFQREFAAPAPFRTRPPDPDLPAVNLAMLAEHCPDGYGSPLCGVYGHARLVQQLGYGFYQTWTGPDFPRVILLTIQHANPYFDDSYAVNSANLGPYGDAITYGLIPQIEKQFRGIGQGWARALAGGSTGGWEALADQIFYPKEYNGSYASCPDPVDFRAYETVNIYADDNAYFKEGLWPGTRIDRASMRDFLDRVEGPVAQENRAASALGSHSRSGGQWDIWQAVFGPQGADGYPVPIWDRRTGKIDHQVADYWRQHSDLRAYLERNWSKIGGDLSGKIHVFVGLSDPYYLTNAVYYMDQYLKGTHDPYYAGSVEYGPFAGHCWSGDHEHMNYITWWTSTQRFIPRMVTHWLRTAPEGADTTSWRYKP